MPILFQIVFLKGDELQEGFWRFCERNGLAADYFILGKKAAGGEGELLARESVSASVAENHIVNFHHVYAPSDLFIGFPALVILRVQKVPLLALDADRKTGSEVGFVAVFYLGLVCDTPPVLEECAVEAGHAPRGMAPHAVPTAGAFFANRSLQSQQDQEEQFFPFHFSQILDFLNFRQYVLLIYFGLFFIFRKKQF